MVSLSPRRVPPTHPKTYVRTQRAAGLPMLMSPSRTNDSKVPPAATAIKACVACT